MASTVPGSTVDLTTITWAARLVASARPNSTPSRSRARRSWLPFERAGVPTQTKDSSEPWIAAATSSVTSTRPLATTSATNSRMPTSMMGERPSRSMASLLGSMSTPITW